MLSVRIADDRLHVGDRFSVSFQRTLRIPDDEREYPLPPGLGRFPISGVDGSEDVFVIPMYQREALWLGFDAADWKPNAVQIGIGRINAVSGEAWAEGLHADPQDYMVCPPQLWLDGINAGTACIRQFVAMPLGSGTTVEAQLTGKEEFGGIQIRVYEPRSGRFPDQPPVTQSGFEAAFAPSLGSTTTMGIAAGGRIRQKIYPDPHGISAWDADNRGQLSVCIVNSEQYEALTGFPPAPSPISAATYTEWGLPWFDLYDEDLGDIAAPDRLRKVKSVDEMEREQGGRISETRSVDVPEWQIRKLGRPTPTGVERKEGDR
jgi:hypothetical protein